MASVHRGEREGEENVCREGERSIVGQVSNWKDDWLVKGYEHGKPTEITQDVWDGLIRYWNMQSLIKVSNSSSSSRLTKDEHGNLSMLHSTGQKPHVGIHLEMENILIN